MARVLVVEDNPASLELMVYLLKAYGHTPLSARDGLKGIEAARREIPDLILCDIQLPGASGIDVCRELKQDPALRDVPLLAVTAYAMVGDREKLLGEGFNGYLSKPINPETFINQVAPYLKTSKLPPVTEAVPETKRPEVQITATILVVDNSPVNISLSRSILEPFGYKIIPATSVDEALGLLREQTIDLILSDLHMPAKDGFDLIHAVMADTVFRKIPVIIISSTMWAERERERALLLGAAQFINRPIEPEDLIAEIEECRERQKKEIECR